MPLLLLKLLGIGKWLKEAATALLRIAGRHPWQAALIAALCLSGWQWQGKRAALAERDVARAETAKALAAGIKARDAQIALNKAAEAKAAAIAKDTDDAHAKALALANDRTERWIAANRVRQAGGSRPGGTSAAAEGETAGLPQAMPADAVMVGAADVRICTARSQDALSAYEFGQALIKAGVAE